MDSSAPTAPSSAKDWFEQGTEKKRAGDLAGALDAFRHSIKLNPRVAAPWIGLADVLETNSQLEDARQCLLRAVHADPNFLMARIRLSSAHKGLGHMVEAERELFSAVEIDPEAAAAHFAFGQLYEDLGQREAAVKAYRKTLELEPNSSEALANLLGLGRHADLTEEIADAHKRLASADTSSQALIGYGLGKALERAKRYEDAFSAYDRANQTRRATSGPFDRDAFDARINQMIELFSEDFFKSRQGWGDASRQPVFIVGLPRSGTTLTEQIIASHPDCFGAGELNTLSDLATGTPDRLDVNDPSWPAIAPQMKAQHVQSLAQDYLTQSSGRAPNASARVIDKQPLNFWHLGLVALALPNARILHCTRDLRDCGFSIFAHNFNAQQGWSTDLGDIAHYWRGYRRLMAHWKSVTDLQIMDVPYEETVANLDDRARALLTFLDLPWNDQVLSFHENERAVQTPSRWQVRQPVYKSSVARWRHYQRHLHPLTEAVEVGQ